ncbi:MAG: acyl-CoA desaturase [Candidatus Sungbacteria bacterium]|nr:acyl-CoA desaturase [Candidatus Sungbacteria bacterium]
MHISKRPADRIMASLQIILHAVFIAAIIYWYYFGFHTLSWVLAGIFTIGGGLGVTLAYHRMLTHKSFICTNIYVRRTLIYFGGLLQNAPSWVRNHMAHHAYTDTRHDPHSPYWPYNGGFKGFWWSHMFWLNRKYLPPSRILYNPELNDRDIQWEHRWHKVFVASGFLIPFLIGGLYGLTVNGVQGFFLYGLDSFLLAGIIRTTASLHITFSINSFGHMLGWKARKHNDPFFIQDSSRTNPALAALSFGEGNHGDHHLYERSARIGLLDFSWPVILLFERMGIFINVKRPPWMIVRK